MRVIDIATFFQNCRADRYQQISVIFILPETKGMSLERMDKVFGEVDAVAAGEESTSAEKIEAITYSGGDIKDVPSHVEDHVVGIDRKEKEG